VTDVDETRKAAVVSAARALREDRLGGGIAVLTAAGYGLMVSKASLVADGAVEVAIMDLVGEQRQVGEGTGAHVAGALLKALGPLLEQAGRRPAKLRGINGGKRRSITAPVVEEPPTICCSLHATGAIPATEPCGQDMPHPEAP